MFARGNTRKEQSPPWCVMPARCCKATGVMQSTPVAPVLVATKHGGRECQASTTPAGSATRAGAHAKQRPLKHGSCCQSPHIAGTLQLGGKPPNPLPTRGHLQTGEGTVQDWISRLFWCVLVTQAGQAPAHSSTIGGSVHLPHSRLTTTGISVTRPSRPSCPSSRVAATSQNPSGQPAFAPMCEVNTYLLLGGWYKNHFAPLSWANIELFGESHSLASVYVPS